LTNRIFFDIFIKGGGSMRKNWLAVITRWLLLVLFGAVAVGMILSLFRLNVLFDLFPDEYSGDTVYRLFIMGFLLLAGSGALLIILDLVKMLKTAQGDPFVQKNVAALRRMGFAALAESALFFVKTVIFFTPMTAVSGLVLLMCGLFSLVLAGVFGKAVLYKQENDLTI
jgi:hypothetical protein